MQPTQAVSFTPGDLIIGARRLSQCVVALTLAASLTLSASPARAQSEAKAASVSTFDDAQRLLAEGKVAEACLRFEESQRLDPQLGTLLNLADCLEKSGRTASAWSAFREAGELAAQRQDPRQQLAEERVQSLTPHLSKLQLNVPSSLDPATLQIERDKVVVGRGLWGTPTPVDPGEHVITASAPGRRSWKISIVVAPNGASAIVNVPELAKEAARSPETSLAPARTAKPAAAKSNADAEPNPPRWTAFTALGVGVVGVAVGSVFGLSSRAKRDESEKYCPGNVCPDSRGVELANDAITAGNISTVAFVVGGIGLTAGATLWLVGTPPASSQNESALRVGVTPTRFVLERNW